MKRLLNDGLVLAFIVGCMICGTLGFFLGKFI